MFDNRSHIVVFFLLLFFACTEWDLERIGFTQVITIGAIEVGSNSAFLIGDIEDIRMASIVESGFILSSFSTDNDGLRLNNPNVLQFTSPGLDTISEDRAFAARAIGLNGSTEYFFRAYAKIVGEDQVVYGNIDQFITSALTLAIESVTRSDPGCPTAVVFNVEIGGFAPGGMTEVNLTYSNDVKKTIPSNNDGSIVTGGIPSSGSIEIAMPVECNSTYFVRAFIDQSPNEPLYTDLFAFSTDPDGCWIPRTSFTGISRKQPYAFAIDQKLYLGGGISGRRILSDQNEYSLETDSWRFVGNMDSLELYATSNASSQGKGVVFNGTMNYNKCGFDDCGCQEQACSSAVGDAPCAVVLDCPATAPSNVSLVPCECQNQRIFIFDPGVDQWQGIGDFPGLARKSPTTFNSSELIFSGLGYQEIVEELTGCICSDGQFALGELGMRSSFYFKDIWSFDLSANNWIRYDDFPGDGRLEPVGFAVGGKNFVGLGYDFEWRREPQNYFQEFSTLTDFYSFDPDIPTGTQWERFPDFPGNAIDRVGFGSNNKGYVLSNDSDVYELWSINVLEGSNAQWQQINIPVQLAGVPEVVLSHNNLVFVYLSRTSENFWLYVPSL